MGINFGNFKSKKPPTATTETPGELRVKIPKPQVDYKQKCEDLQKALENTEENMRAYMKSHETAQRNFENAMKAVDELSSEVEALRIQETNLKKYVDTASLKLSQLQFSPREFGELALVLGALHVNASTSQHQQLDKIVGSHLIADVREWIIDILSKPYEVVKE